MLCSSGMTIQVDGNWACAGPNQEGAYPGPAVPIATTGCGTSDVSPTWNSFYAVLQVSGGTECGGNLYCNCDECVPTPLDPWLPMLSTPKFQECTITLLTKFYEKLYAQYNDGGGWLVTQTENPLLDEWHACIQPPVAPETPGQLAGFGPCGGCDLVDNATCFPCTPSQPQTGQRQTALIGRLLLNANITPQCAEVQGCGASLKCFTCALGQQLSDCTCVDSVGTGISVVCPTLASSDCESSSSEKSLLLLLLLLLLLIPLVCCCLALLACCIRRKKTLPPAPLPPHGTAMGSPGVFPATSFPTADFPIAGCPTAGSMGPPGTVGPPLF
eukprot:NODE_908_length_1699_cov_5.672121_g741_i0.p1 GENE.NODE_908_length_1699_cov_5.672121_g741_i0~~NODE_908_length_1699_cov_5.672121_g741_i0.p1  ORF type:complete len:329 (+),score=32.09 NODE_908_length_1699_cov_5.672121_g741_i0:412-1398(+)